MTMNSHSFVKSNCTLSMWTVLLESCFPASWLIMRVRKGKTYGPKPQQVKLTTYGGHTKSKFKCPLTASPLQGKVTHTIENHYKLEWTEFIFRRQEGATCRWWEKSDDLNTKHTSVLYSRMMSPRGLKQNKFIRRLMNLACVCPYCSFECNVYVKNSIDWCL